MEPPPPSGPPVPLGPPVTVPPPDGADVVGAVDVVEVAVDDVVVADVLLDGSLELLPPQPAPSATIAEPPNITPTVWS